MARSESAEDELAAVSEVSLPPIPTLDKTFSFLSALSIRQTAQAAWRFQRVTLPLRPRALIA